MFDITLQVVGIEIVKVDDHLELHFIVALAIPNGPGQIAHLPAGIVRIGVSRDTAIEKGQELVTEGEALPKKTDIQIATSLNEDEVKKAADFEQSLRGS